MNSPPDAVRVAGALAISRLSSQLVRDVVTSEMLAQFQLTAQQSLQLSERVSIDLDAFNTAVATAASHGTASLDVKDGSDWIAVRVALESDGAVVVEAPLHKWRIAHAALLSMDVRRRREALTQVLQRHTLQSNVKEQVIRTIEKANLTNAELLNSLKALNASPESFVQQLATRLREGKTGVMDFLPDESNYWGNITAPCAESKTLAEFIGHELAQERATRIGENAQLGFLPVAYSFAATELVPLEWFKTLDVEVIVQGIESVVCSTDHAFALAGAFEVCADALDREDRLGPLGDQVLDKLFADPTRLVRRCKFLSAIFIIASTQLAMHAQTREKPAFWRRLAAATHAGWVMQACESANVDESKFLRWVMGERGQEYMLSACHDMQEQPRWQPEWVDAEFIIPDIFGRVYAALAKCGDRAPTSWRNRLEKMRNWIEEQEWEARIGLPSVLQGSREREMPRPEGQLALDMRAVFDEFAREPSLERLLALTGWIEFFGLGAEAIPGAKLVLQQLGTTTDVARSEGSRAAMTVCTRLAVVAGDHELAQVTADTYVERYRLELAGMSITQLVFQLIECASADVDRDRRLDTLGGYLTSLAFTLPAGDACAELLVLLENLQKIDDQLAPRLARAVHAARASMAAPAL
jgi:hypothetical protein